MGLMIRYSNYVHVELSLNDFIMYGMQLYIWCLMRKCVYCHRRTAELKTLAYALALSGLEQFPVCYRNNARFQGLIRGRGRNDSSLENTDAEAYMDLHITCTVHSSLYVQ